MKNLIFTQPIKGLFLTALIAICLMYGLSWYHDRQLIINPVNAFNGASLEVQSIAHQFSEGESRSRENLVHRELLEKFNSDAESLPNQEFSVSSLDLAGNKMEDLLATNELRKKRLQEDTERLKNTNQQILNSRTTLNSLSQDFSSITAYEQQELARQELIDSAINPPEDVPTEQQASALIAQRGRTGQKQSNTIPKRVLTNIQNTTGISPDEIESLMNQQD